MIRAAARLALALWAAVSVTLAAWTFAQRPFGAPLVARSAEQARIALSRAVADRATPEWLAPRLDAAIAADAPDEVRLYLDLAGEQDIALPDGTRARAAAVLATDEGFWAGAASCATCAWDIAACRSVAAIGGCALPIELSPLGDLNALRRAGTDWLTGAEVDEVEAALAALGLGATATIVVSGGGSAAVKLGATALRLARRMGALPPGLLRAAQDASGAALRGTDEGAALTALVKDLGKVASHTSASEALVLLRYAEDAPALARLARLAEVAGPDTRKTLAVLGPARAFRLLTRVGDLALAAAGLAGLLLGQLAALAGAVLKLAARRALRRETVAKAGSARP